MINLMSPSCTVYVLCLATKSVDTVPAAMGGDDGEYQKCVKFTPDQKHVITAASDGSCKIFKVSVYLVYLFLVVVFVLH